MNNLTSSIFSRALVGTVLLTGCLFAQEGEDQTQTEHIPVGDRAITHLERVKTMEFRSSVSERLENGEKLTEEETAELSEKEKEEIATGENLTQISEEDSTLIKKSVNATTYYTTHQGAFHSPYAVSLLGDTVELEDGSIWAVASSDRYKTLDWFTSDIIIITPNHTWFSAYDYRLININTGASVKVNLGLGPIYNGVYTHWILAIDYFNNEICLEDGSVWHISSFDDSEFSKWLPNDTIIMGINDGFLSGTNPNVLINVNVNNWARGFCIY